MDMPYHSAFLLQIWLAAQEVIGQQFSLWLPRILRHRSQAPPGVREMSSFCPGANHLTDIYLTRPGQQGLLCFLHCPTPGASLAKILGIWHVSLRPPGLHPETPSGGASSPSCLDPTLLIQSCQWIPVPLGPPQRDPTPQNTCDANKTNCS